MAVAVARIDAAAVAAHKQRDPQDLATDFWRAHGDLLDISSYRYANRPLTFKGAAPLEYAMDFGYAFEGDFTVIKILIQNGAASPVRLAGHIALQASDFIL